MRLGFLMVTTMLLVQGCNPATNDSTADTTTIDVEDYDFAPGQDTVTVGSNMTATVTFVWVNGAEAHDVTWDSGPGATLPPNSQTLTGGSAYDVILPAGTYTYHCSIHFSTKGMAGKIVVLPPSGM